MTTHIHPTAVVDPSAELAVGVRVGPLAVIGPRVVVGEGTEIGASACVEGPTRLGKGNHIFSHACIGFEPQDLKFEGEEVFLEVGDNNHFREFSTVHRGTGVGGGTTRIGDDNLFMAYSHVAHDSQVGSRCVLVNGATLAGHVEVQDDATIGANSAIHQFCRVGRHAYIGGYSVITMDALPFVKTVGLKAVTYGVNNVGLRRKGVPRESIKHLRRALRLLLQKGLNTSQAVEAMRAELAGDPEVDFLIEFVLSAKRGFVKALPGRRGERGGSDPDGESGGASASGVSGEPGGSGADDG
ncbi:MAG: acyl-ACP--UDP-N-acetylglucosamine O-acyltransferase [Acidobacteriota bacterium]